ncbi:hypothetical protein [Peptoniphilus catoniae]|uniref:hypothetical protein n=1 Tax=Peptoniphilus catoniae TaxID=1660341 RepID=UPI0010FCE74C|nr:hypothetical protein [Peptoniphilus catoniae]
MNNRFGKALLLIILIFILSSCALIDANVSKIEEPSVARTPINGKWTVTKIIFKNEDEEDPFKYKELIGKDVLITEKGFIYGNKSLYNPTFKAKKLESSKYLQRKYEMDEKKLNISSKYLTIVDIYKDNDIIFEILKTDEDRAFIDDSDIFIQINRISDEVEEEEYNQALERIKN